MNPIRRAMFWWLSPPASPYVSVNGSADFLAARAYLDGLNAGRESPITVNHLLAATVARVLHEFPVANQRLVGGRFLKPPHVGIAMPVNLLGHPGEAKRELGMMVLSEAETLSLDDVAATLRRHVASERSGTAHVPLFRRLISLAELAPGGALERALDFIDRARHSATLNEKVFALAPVTTAFTNPGAGFEGLGASQFKAAAFNLPDRLIHISTFWGLSFIQDEVVVVDGEPAVRPMLPFLFVFDHRTFDGVMCGRILRRFVEILQDPESVFGDGTTPPA